MEIDAYRAFTAELVERLESDERVVGLVALGSMAECDYPPDDFSDHDFFVITEPGVQEALRSGLGWLPRATEAVLTMRETEHGLKVVYDDGHLLEFAVFDLDEIGLARVNRYRVLLDRGGVVGRLDEVARETAARERDPVLHFGQFVTRILVGVGRHRRGETLSGAFFVKSLAASDLLVLLALVFPAALLDDQDPYRRFEAVHPEVAGEVNDLLALDSLAAARGLLDLAERELRPRLPALQWDALDVVRTTIG